MHELSVTESVLKLVLEEAGRAQARSICAVNLAVGEYSAVVPDAVEFYWGFLSRDTIAEKARLSFRQIPARVRCWECGEEYHPLDRDWRCPACGSAQAHVLEGEEFRVESIDID